MTALPWHLAHPLTLFDGLEHAAARLPERVARHIIVDASGCWLWVAGTNGKSYGAVRVQPNGPKLLAHRVVYELLVGPIPPGLQIDHLCRVTLCVNPDHLEPVTHGENLRRGYAARGPKILCKRGHELAVHGRLTRDGRRDCRVCDRVRDAEARQRQSS